MLKIAILSTLGFAAAGSIPVAQAQEVLPTIEVTGNYYPNPIFLGPNLGPVYSWMLWSWPNTDVGDLNNYSGNFGIPETCSLLSASGRAQDCNRQLVQDFMGIIFCAPVCGTIERPNMPKIPPISNWLPENIWPPNAQFATIFQLAESAANYNLEWCYIDPSQDPDFCESQYISMLDVCDDPVVTNGKGGVTYCEAGLQNAQQRVNVARADRLIASWVDVTWSSHGLFGVEVNVNLPFDQTYLNMHPYNRQYYWLRKGHSCENWYRTWDGQNCSTWYTPPA
jgi:hypothetical protein